MKYDVYLFESHNDQSLDYILDDTSLEFDIDTIEQYIYEYFEEKNITSYNELTVYINTFNLPVVIALLNVLHEVYYSGDVLFGYYDNEIENYVYQSVIIDMEVFNEKNPIQ